MTAAILLIVAYEAYVWTLQRSSPQATARSVHAQLRDAWVAALSNEPGSEMTAVQTLRNSLMSATISASTSAIALMGTLSLTARSVAHEVRASGGLPSSEASLQLLLLATLFSSYVCSSMAMRYFNHAGFVMSLPVHAAARRSREPMASTYVKRAGVLYSWGLRCFLFVAPLVAGLMNPYAMPPAAVGLVLVLRIFDEVPALNAARRSQPPRSGPPSAEAP